MTKVHELDRGLEDYNITVTESELEAIRTVVEDADGRKSEVKVSREILGIN